METLKIQLNEIFLTDNFKKLKTITDIYNEIYKKS